MFLAVMLAAAPAAAQPFKGTKQPDVRHVPSRDSVIDAMLKWELRPGTRIVCHQFDMG